MKTRSGRWHYTLMALIGVLGLVALTTDPGSPFLIIAGIIAVIYTITCIWRWGYWRGREIEYNNKPSANQSDAARSVFDETKVAAERGDVLAQFDLGIYYGLGQGIPKDDAEAVKWWHKAADQNLAPAQLNLGICYGLGRGVTKDDAEAVKWWRKAAEQNQLQAQSDLGAYYAKSQGAIKDNMEAVERMRTEVEQSILQAQSNLGACYEKGQGVERDIVEALKWYRKAAEQGGADGQHSLGFCYANGIGVTKDEVEAVQWYRKAAEQNLAKAQHNLGLCYYNGQGVAKDLVQTIKWWVKAAEQNVVQAQSNLGCCYGNGHGVPRDYLQAYKWLNLALAQGDEVAKTWLPVVEQQMSPKEIAEALRLCREFLKHRSSDSSSGASGGLADGQNITNNFSGRDEDETTGAVWRSIYKLSNTVTPQPSEKIIEATVTEEKIVTCNKCGSRNRVFVGDGRHYQCGQCKNPIAEPSIILPKPVRIVVVDDEPMLLEGVAREILDKFKNVTLLKFEDGMQAWQELLRETPDVLITDMNRAGLSGWKMLPLLAERKVKFPIMVTSGAAGEKEVCQCAGPSLNITFLNKPYRFEQITEFLREKLGDSLLENGDDLTTSIRKYLDEHK